MGTSEVALLVTVISLAGVAALGCNLVVAIWKGRPARRVGLAGWLALILLAASALFVQDTPEDVALVASATQMVACEATLETTGGRSTVLRGGWKSPACNLWALIEDPRTGTLWVQGPASMDGDAWTLQIVLGIEGAPPSPLIYGLEVLTVSDEVHDAWLTAAVGGRPIVLASRPPDARRIGHGLQFEVGGQP
jgi:hypothetical protein